MGIYHDTIYDHNKGELSHKYDSPDDYYKNNTCRYHSMSWDSLNDIMNTCRNKAKGKPISSCGRLKQDSTNGDIYLCDDWDVNGRYWTVSKDNIVTFHMDSSNTGGQTVVSSMPNWFPVGLSRRGTGDYRVVFGWDYYKHVKDFTDKSDKIEWTKRYKLTDGEQKFFSNSPYVFDGLQYDLNNHCFINAKSMEKSVEYPEKRKQWRALLTKHKRVLKSMISIGMFKKLEEDLAKLPNEVTSTYRWYSLPWNRVDFVEYVLSHMAKDELPEVLLRMYAFHFSTKSDTITTGQVDSFFSEYGFSFKEYLGVFKSLGYKHQHVGRRYYGLKDLTSNPNEQSLESIIKLFTI